MIELDELHSSLSHEERVQFMPDGIHLSDAGSDRVAQEVLLKIRD